MVVGRVIITAIRDTKIAMIVVAKIVAISVALAIGLDIAEAVVLVTVLLKVIGRDEALSPSPPSPLSLLLLLLLLQKTLLLITYNKHTINMSTLTKPLKGICIPTTRYRRSRNIITIMSDDNRMSRIICTSTASAIKYIRQYAR